MNRPDLDELADLWTEPVVAEQAEFDALARKARRKGRWLAHADLAMAVLLIGGSLFALFLAQGPVTIAAAILILFFTLFVTWKRRAIRQMASTLKTTDRRAFVESSMRNAKANLRRATLSLTLLPAVILLAVAFKISHRAGGTLEASIEALLGWGQSPRGLVTLALMACFAAAMLRSRRKIKAELRRLAELRQAYEEEEAFERGSQD